MMPEGLGAVVGDDEEVLVVLDDSLQEQGVGPLADQAVLRVQSADLDRRVASPYAVPPTAMVPSSVNPSTWDS
jgi:hypothetical protein